MSNSLMILAAFLLGNTCIAQSKKKIIFSSVNQVGVLTGAQRDALLVQSINGVTLKNWSGGIGVGIDNYSERSIPLFIDVRRKFGQNSNAPFVYADGGINFGWLNFIQRENRSFPNYEQPSWFYDAGVGWKISLRNKSAFILSAGFTLKQLKGERIGYGPFVGGRSLEYPEEFENIYRRVVIKMGVEL